MLTPLIFLQTIGQIITDHEGSYSGSLEAYLRSLLTLVLRHAETTPSHEQIAHFIADAFVTSPIAFDSDWLAYTQPIIIQYRALDSLPHSDIDDTQRHPNDGTAHDFAILKHTLLFQIADLYRMGTSRGKPLWQYPEDRSPTDNSWYNVDVFVYLECAIAGMTSHIAKEYLTIPFA